MRVQTCTCEVFQSCDRCTTYVGGKRSEDDNKKVFQKNIQNDLSGINLVQVKEQNHKSTGIKPPKEMIKSCKRCDKMNINLGLRHIESPLKYKMGKGTSGKSHPKGTAYLCDFCDNIMSNQRPDKGKELARALHDNEWLWFVWRTWLEHLT